MSGRVGFTAKVVVPTLLRKALGTKTRKVPGPYPFCSGWWANQAYFAERNSYAEVCSRWWQVMKSPQAGEAYEKLLEGCFNVEVHGLDPYCLEDLTPTIPANKTINYYQQVQYIKKWVSYEPSTAISIVPYISVIDDGSQKWIDDGNQRYHATQEAGVGKIMAVVWRVK